MEVCAAMLAAHAVALTCINSWLTFWKMVRHALSLAKNRPCPVNESLWPRTPLELMPSLDFMKMRIRDCYEDFVAREQLEGALVPGIEEVLVDVRGLLDSQ